MAVDKTPILKRCRSLGLDPIYLGITKSSKRDSKRGNHKLSEYGSQLKEKQKAKFIYGMLETPFHNYFLEAKRTEGLTGENLMILLERRLDSVIFRLGYARTRRESRQIVSHSQVTVNGKNVNIASYLVSVGDKIEIRENCKSLKRYKDVLEVTEGRIVPEWLSADHEKLSGEVLQLPTRAMIDVPVDEMAIVELYSK